MYPELPYCAGAEGLLKSACAGWAEAGLGLGAAIEPARCDIVTLSAEALAIVGGGYRESGSTDARLTCLCARASSESL